MPTFSTFPAAIALSLAAAVAMMPVPVDAAASRSRIIRLADYDLGRADHRAALEKRLKAMARAVCATGNDSVARTVEADCTRDTLAAIATRRS